MDLRNFEVSKSGNYIVFGILGGVLITILIYVFIYLYTLYYTWKNDSDDLNTWRRDKFDNIKSNELEQLHQLQEVADTSMIAKSTKTEPKNKKK